MSVLQRLLSKAVIDPGGCWVFTGAIANNGYGRIGIGPTVKQAHRVAYELLVGPVPEGLDLDHLCRVRACINPTHLEPVTRLENVRRGTRWTVLPQACKRGHPFTADNVMNNHGNRQCKTCHNARSEQRRRAAGMSVGHPSKLEPADVREIRRRAGSGERQADLAREFGVSPSSVCDILSGRTWRHVA